MIRLPLSQTGPADKFAQAVQKHIEALQSHMLGPAGKPSPRASSDLIERVIMRQVQGGPVATRGPDKFLALPYEIYDDLVTPEQAKTISFLRDSIA